MLGATVVSIPLGRLQRKKKRQLWTILSVRSCDQDGQREQELLDDIGTGPQSSCSDHEADDYKQPSSDTDSDGGTSSQKDSNTTGQSPVTGYRILLARRNSSNRKGYLAPPPPKIQGRNFVDIADDDQCWNDNRHRGVTCFYEDYQQILYLGAVLYIRGDVVHNHEQELKEYADEDELEHTDSNHQYRNISWIIPHEVHLVRCAPDPVAIFIVLNGILRDQYKPSSLLYDRLSAEDIMSSYPKTSRARRSNDSNQSSVSSEEQELPSRSNTNNINSVEDTDSIGRDWAQRILALSMRQRRLAIARILRCLQGKLIFHREPRRRVPTIRRCDLAVLDQVQAIAATWDQPNNGSSWSWITPIPVALQCEGEDYRGLATECAVFLQGYDAQHHIRSQQPDQIKKDFQIRWMVQCINRLWTETMTTLHNGTLHPTHILDVGGGQGYLARFMAQTWGQAHVSVVDKNDRLIDAARVDAEEDGIEHRLYFVKANFADYCRDPTRYYAQQSQPHNDQQQPTPSSLIPLFASSPPPIDLVVALHACGDLSDLALEFALQRRCPFVICPCCYTKQYIDQLEPSWMRFCTPTTDTPDPSSTAQVLCRLAELTERPDISRRAMIIVNSMRIRALFPNYEVRLEEYESHSSQRNLVLVGYPVNE